MFLLFFVRPNTSCIVHIVVHTQCFFVVFQHIYVCCASSAFSHVSPCPFECWLRNLSSMATERYYSKVLSLPHSSTFFCLVYVTLPSFSSFSLYVVPSFCHFLSTFVLARFCRYCRCSSCVVAAFSVPRPFRPAFRDCRCCLCAPFAFFLLLSALLFRNHRKPAICSTPPRTART